MPRFVVQLHDATTLHYDFRLEIGRKYVSWAVPKGPSTDPRDKRLAMRVEDHGLTWGKFEGRIGGGYGKGAVIVWDRGNYSHLREGSLRNALRDGHLVIELEGEKLRGAWALIRTPGPGRERWLLMKQRDEHAGARLDPRSVKSGRTIDEV